MGRFTVVALEAALDIVAIVTKHAQDNLVLQGVLQRGGEVGGIDAGEVVDVGSEPQQDVDHLQVTRPQSHLQEGKKVC